MEHVDIHDHRVLSPLWEEHVVQLYVSQLPYIIAIIPYL